MTHTVRTTRWPDRDIEVDDAEYLDLQRWGQIITPPQPEPAEAVPEQSIRDEQAPAPAATQSASAARRRRSEGEPPPTTPPARG